ncbi:MAG: VanZ family protein [Oscillospiraceae bacterium]|nr:VanZ family protein [Oscillospiraceae bacterium]
MGAIFLLSEQRGAQSSGASNSLSGIIIDLFVDFDFDDTNDIEGNNYNIYRFKDSLNVLVRKFAHFTIFFTLGFCVANAISRVTDNKKYIFLISLCWSSFYGATDEWHQYFVPGRQCRWQDWAVDTAGAFTGVCAALFIFWAVKKFKKIKKIQGGFRR